MIGIIGAMAIEIDALTAAMEEKKEQTTAGMTFTEGKLAGVPCVVVQCGAGKVNAAMCAQALLMLYHPTCVLNIGVAGGIGPGVHIGDLVVADGRGAVRLRHHRDRGTAGLPFARESGGDPLRRGRWPKRFGARR